MSIEDTKRPVSQLFSDLVVAECLGEIEIDGYPGLTVLPVSALKSESPDADAKAHRFELISAVRGGKHVELAITAQTFEQTKAPNRRFLRLADDKLASRAPTWKGQPYLTDHNTYSISSSQGTILSSKAIETPGGIGFEQKINAVTADAVIGILNGTFNKFSIGWWMAGPVLCSAHGCDVASDEACGCWPGDQVTLAGGKKHTVEFVFTDFRGKETSTVVLPAVQNTSISEIRAALAAELSIPTTRTRHPTRTTKETKMLFHRLAVALGLTALSEGDEDRALAAVSALQARANTAETQLTTARASLAQAESAVQTLTAAQLGVQVAATLEQDGFASGRLRRHRDANGVLAVGPVEGWLRKLGAEAGIEVMKAQLAAMPVIVPIGHRQVDAAKEPALTDLGADQEDGLNEQNPYLINAAQLTGQKVGDLVAFAKGHIAGGTP